MNRKDTEAGRFYADIPDHPGLSLPSVTTVLGVVAKPSMVDWVARVERELVVNVAADLYEAVHGTPRMTRMAYTASLLRYVGEGRAGDKLKARAGEIGTELHGLIEWALLKEVGKEPPGREPTFGQALAIPWAHWCDWRREHKLSPQRVEQTVWSIAHGYAGTIDCVAELDGHLTVMDWKTGRRIYPEARLQVAAYRHALIEMGHADRNIRAAVVRVPKTSADRFEMATMEPPDCEQAFETFLAARELWAWLRAQSETPMTASNKPATTAQEVTTCPSST